MKTITAKFNVAKITNYGNGGGSKVVLLPVRVPGHEPANDRIELDFACEPPFEFGVYDVSFTPEQAKSPDEFDDVQGD